MTVVVDKFSKLQEMIDRIIEAQEMAAQVDDSHERQIEKLQIKVVQVDDLRKQQIEELQLKTEGLRYAVIALGAIIAVHILYHVLLALSLGV